MRTNGSDAPAFAEAVLDGTTGEYKPHGMTKREFAAVTIMAQLVAAQDQDEVPKTKHLAFIAAGAADALFDELAS